MATTLGMTTTAAVLASKSVPPGITAMFAAILVALILCLALEEKLHAKKSVIVGLFVVVTLFLGAVCGILPFEKVVVGSHRMPSSSAAATDEPVDEDHTLHEGGHEIEMPVYIPAVDWGVIVIILGSSLFVDVVSRTGLFTWVAIKVTKASRGDPFWLLICYGCMTVIFSAVLNNVTAMVIVGSLTVVSLEKLGQRDKLLGFLLTEGLLTNIGGLLTLISSVPNIIVGRAANISFMSFFFQCAPYVALTTAVTLWLAMRTFQIRRLTSAAEREDAAKLVATFDENDGVESLFFFWFGAIMTVLFIITIATTSVLPWVSDLGMGFVAMSFAAVMMIRYKNDADKLYQVIDWDLIGFFAGLFIVINVMEHALVLDWIGAGLARLVDLGPRWGAATLLAAAAVSSSVTDDIPLAAMLAKILTSLQVPITSDAGPASPLWWSVIFGANLGGNITPIGSASTLVSVTIMHRHGLPLSFFRFVRVALPFAIVQIVLAVIYVLVTA